MGGVGRKKDLVDAFGGGRIDSPPRGGHASIRGQSGKELHRGTDGSLKKM